MEPSVDSYLPIQFSGGDLGQRHRYLNSEVLRATSEFKSFRPFRDAPEQTSLDRLFKIELAIKLKDLRYIHNSLKQDDMLAVSRALKCKWLFEHPKLMKPKFLEENLFPDMSPQAISKIKHCFYKNIREPSICQRFYRHYKKTNFEYAIKFLNRCDIEYVLVEFPKVLLKITPHYLKVFGEKCPELIKIYYDSLETDDKLVERYLQEELKFYKNIICILKSSPDVFLDIAEKYHPSLHKLSASATDYIMRYRKSRFMSKPELYFIYLLHVPSVARHLSALECQNLMIRIARSKYLDGHFIFKDIQYLINRISPDTKIAFAKRVFKDRDVGERITIWPYEMPSSPCASGTGSDRSHVFDEIKFEPIQLRDEINISVDAINELTDACRELMSFRQRACLKGDGVVIAKTELQHLLDEFRFTGFDDTLNELKVRIHTVMSADRSRDMLLVLVNKTGGHASTVRAVLQLAMRLRNDPAYERAAVIRSLVRRVKVWRLPQDVWTSTMDYAYGLGLDGSEPEAECREGLHAVVLRQLLCTGRCEPEITNAFLENFSTLTEYKLIQSERVVIADELQYLLITAAAKEEPMKAAKHLDQLLDVHNDYHIPFERSPTVSVIMGLADRDFEVAKPLLMRLYNARVGRRELFHYNIKFRHDDAALLNVLRHDPKAISPEEIVNLLTTGQIQVNQFLIKLALYFNEDGGIAEQVRSLLREKITQEPDVKLARPLATVAGYELIPLWCELDEAGREHKKMAAALRANMHLARPHPNAVLVGWRTAGLKAVALRALRCRHCEIIYVVDILLKERHKRPVRLALILAQRDSNLIVDIFSRSVTISPLATLRAAILYFRKAGNKSDPKIWDIVKSLIPNVNLNSRIGLRHVMEKIEWIPNPIKADYCALLYLALSKTSASNADHVLKNLMECLSEASKHHLENAMLWMIENIDKGNESYPAMVIRYLMLSKNYNELRTRLSKIGDVFLKKIKAFYKVKDNSKHNLFFQKNLRQLINSLQYNLAFFDVKYQYCLPVIEWVSSWMKKFMPKETYFAYYVTINMIISYYKAVRQSIEQHPEVFQDPVRKTTEGVEVVGFIFGEYVAKEVAQLKSKYFDSIIEIYSDAFKRYLREYISYGAKREEFIIAIIKGIVSGSVGSEIWLAIHILKSEHTTDPEAILKLIMKNENKSAQFFLHAV